MASGDVRISRNTEDLSSDDRAAETKSSGGGEIGMKKSGEVMEKKKKNTRILPLGCFRSDYGVSTVERSDSNGNLDMESASAAGGGGGGMNCRPNHLVVMVNGIIGSAKDWRYAAKHFLKKYPNDIIVHCSKRNHTTQTFKGVDIMGMRLADEVLTVLENYPNLEKISFVGHSLGGLVARYAVAKLYTKATIEEEEEEEEEEKGKIAGLEPVNFITFATPHLGCRGHKQAPAFCGSYAMEKAAAEISGILGRSGKHLFLKDGQPPLLIQMTKDIDDLPFMSSLQSFPRRVAYANARFDFLVGWSTSSLRLQHELPKRRNMMRNENYPHILEVGGGSVKKTTSSSPTILAQVKRSKTAQMEEEMMKGLSKLRWERVDVDFGSSTQRLMAHNTIQVQNYSMHSEGADVIQHMIDNFLL